MPVWMLQRVMPEAEFNSHRLQMAMDPDPDVRLVYLLKMLIPLSAGQINAWGGKVRIGQEHLDPWEAARDKSGAEDRIKLWAEQEFGVTLDGG